MIFFREDCKQYTVYSLHFAKKVLFMFTFLVYRIIIILLYYYFKILIINAII